MAAAPQANGNLGDEALAELEDVLAGFDDGEVEGDEDLSVGGQLPQAIGRLAFPRNRRHTWN
jgi:hypothetical protein